MSLVHYSDSDSEDSDVEQQQQQPSIHPQNLKKRGLSSLLPPPKKTKTIQIEAPKFEQDDDEEEPVKPMKTTTGLGLADLLPAPKNYKGPVPVTKTTTAFMPHSLSEKKLKGKEPEVQKKEEVEEDVSEEEFTEKETEEPSQPSQKFTGSFFRLSKIACIIYIIDLKFINGFIL